MASMIAKVLEIARSQIGYSRWDDPNYGTIYGRWYADISGDPYYGTNGVPYCAMFVSWVFDKAGQDAPGLPGAYCPWMVNATRAAGMAVAARSAQPGDIVYFDWNNDGESDHVGIVEENQGTYLQCIEGNTDNGQVKRRTRDYGTVICVCRPAWKPVSENNVPKVDWDISKGIDIYNGEGYAGMRGDETAAGFVICKASEGVGFKDVFAKQFSDAVVGAGKLLGFYHFARSNDPIQEADYFLARVEETGHKNEATLWLDYEASALGNGPAWCKRFIDRVNEKTGKKCGIYTSQSVTTSQDFSNIAGYVPLWVAQYANYNQTGWQDSPWATRNYGAWGSTCAIHQYSSMGRVDGWGGNLDINRGYFTVEQWSQWANTANVAPVQPQQPQQDNSFKSPNLAVDGWAGAATISAWQAQMGTYVDGVISGQYYGNHKRMANLVSVTWEETGSTLIRAVQRKLGVSADGILGAQSIKAIQKFLGVSADGYFGPDTARALQRSLNEGKWR